MHLCHVSRPKIVLERYDADVHDGHGQCVSVCCETRTPETVMTVVRAQLEHSAHTARSRVESRAHLRGFVCSRAVWRVNLNVWRCRVRLRVSCLILRTFVHTVTVGCRVSCLIHMCTVYGSVLYTVCNTVNECPVLLPSRSFAASVCQQLHEEVKRAAYCQHRV
jgi:hypothetical protein